MFMSKSYKSGKRKGERKTGKAAGIIPLFILKHQIKVPVRIPIQELFARTQPALQKSLDELKRLPI